MYSIIDGVCIAQRHQIFLRNNRSFWIVLISFVQKNISFRCFKQRRRFATLHWGQKKVHISMVSIDSFPFLLWLHSIVIFVFSVLLQYSSLVLPYRCESCDFPLLPNNDEFDRLHHVDDTHSLLPLHISSANLHFYVTWLIFSFRFFLETLCRR